MDDILHNLGQLRSISAVAVLLLLLVWESSAPFGFYFVGNSGERLRHGLKNLVLGILNALLTGLVFVALWWTAAEWAQAHNFGLLNWLPLPGLGACGRRVSIVRRLDVSLASPESPRPIPVALSSNPPF